MGLTGLLCTLTFPLVSPLGPTEELFPSGLLEPLAFVCLVPALVAMRGLRPGQAVLGGYLAGMVFFIGMGGWVSIALGSVPAMLLLVSWFSLHWGVAFGLVRLFELRNGWSAGFSLAPVWMATELARNHLLSGLPWGNLGYSQSHNLWFSQLASLGGVYGLAFCVALVNGALYESLRARLWKERPFPSVLAAVAAAVLLLGHLFGALRVQRWDQAHASHERLRVAVVQGNIDRRFARTEPSYAPTVLRAYAPPTRAADAAGADLIVWPEASFPLVLDKDLRTLTGLGLPRLSSRAHLLLGVDLMDPADLERGNENATFLVTPGLGILHKYVKHHLVPFGEYIPFGLDRHLPLRPLVQATYVPGSSLQPAPLPTPSAQARVGVLICYDAIFPEISREYARQGAEVLINLSNDAWFGFSAGPFQFLRIAALRSIEVGRPMARAANTGISAFIDPLGRIHQATPVGLVTSEARVLSAPQLLPPRWILQELPRMTSPTLYVLIGDTPAYLAVLFCVVGLGLARRRALRAREP